MPEVIRFQSEYLSCEGALVFALEHCVFADRFPRYFANVTGSCPHLDVRQYLIENNYIEEVRDPTIRLGHYESLVEFAVALGARREEVYNHRPSITTVMGLAYFENLTRSRPWLEAFAGLPVLEIVNNDALAARYRQAPLNSPKRWAALGLQGEAMSHWQAARSPTAGASRALLAMGRRRWPWPRNTRAPTRSKRPSPNRPSRGWRCSSTSTTQSAVGPSRRACRFGPPFPSPAREERGRVWGGSMMGGATSLSCRGGNDGDRSGG